ncbi:hypothetical protein B2G51_12740 [Leptospira santarosai]|nr:hypothetical protein B2G51_12740 [Leptospira santarosai]
MRANLKDCFEFPYAKTSGAKNQSLPHYSRKIRAVLYPTTPYMKSLFKPQKEYTILGQAVRKRKMNVKKKTPNSR